VLSLILSAISQIVRTLQWTESNIMAHVNNSFPFFQVGLVSLISLQYYLSFTNFSLGVH